MNRYWQGLMLLGLCLALPLPGTAGAEFATALQEAVLAADPDSRALALQRAQAELGPDPVPAADSVPEADIDQWLAAVEQRVDAMTRETRRQLRETLLYQVWGSPYEGRLSSDPEPEEFEPMVEALRLLHALLELGDPDPAGLAAIQDVYWSWLRAHRERAGMAEAALTEAPGAPVFGQWVLDQPDGVPEIVQLVGTPQRTLRWDRVEENRGRGIFSWHGWYGP